MHFVSPLDTLNSADQQDINDFIKNSVYIGITISLLGGANINLAEKGIFADHVKYASDDYESQ